MGKHEHKPKDDPLSPAEMAKEQDERLAEESAEFEALFGLK